MDNFIKSNVDLIYLWFWCVFREKITIDERSPRKKQKKYLKKNQR